MDDLSNYCSFKTRLSAYLPVFFLLLVLAFLQYDTNLWVNFSGDTVKFLGVEWHMFHSGNYLVPYYDGHIYTDKPPLLFWLTVLGWKLFGVNTFWPQLIVLLFVASWLPLLIRIYNKLYGGSHFSMYEMPWVLGSSVIVLRAIDMYRVDIILTTSILLFINIYLTQIENHSKKDVVKKVFQYIAIFTVGYYAKGPVILIFTCLPVIILCCINRRFSSLYPVIAGAVIGVLFFLPWVFYIYSRSELAGHALVSQIANRSRGLHFHLFSYLGAVLYTTLPWVLVIFLNLKKNIKMITEEARSQHLLVLLSIAIPVLFFCFWGGKVGNRYILPSLLLFLILLSRILSDTGHMFNKVKYMGLVILSVLVVLFFVVSRTPHVYAKLLHTKHIIMPGIFNLPYLILILLPVSYFFCSRRGAFSIRIFAMHFFIFFIVANFFIQSTINNISNFKQFSNSIKKSEYPVFLFKQTVANTNFLSLVVGRGNALSNFNDKDSLLLAMKKNQKSAMYITTTGCLNNDRKVSYYLRKHTCYTLCSNE